MTQVSALQPNGADLPRQGSVPSQLNRTEAIQDHDEKTRQ